MVWATFATPFRTTPMNLKIPMAMGWAMSRIPMMTAMVLAMRKNLRTAPIRKAVFPAASCAFSFDVDESQAAQPLTDGLLVIRHLFGFSGDALTAGAVAGLAGRAASEDITVFLTDADAELDIDGNGKSEPLTDGLLLIRYLFGFSGEALISGAIGSGAERNTAAAVEAYIEARVPLQ